MSEHVLIYLRSKYGYFLVTTNTVHGRTTDRASTLYTIRHTSSFIGASLSEPHIDEFAVNFPYIYLFIYFFISIVRRAVNHFLLVFCVSLRHALIQTTNELAIATSTT